ncbi:MAG TPA: hypothetical protein VJ508_06300 [Saprospiraceae bacterium]|nr:hypothetical protein [Saprospiraceae bacterium]
MDDGTLAFRKRLETELSYHQNKVIAIKSLLRSLDDYEHPLSAGEPVAPTRADTPTERELVDGPTVMERAKKALEIIPQPYILVDLKKAVEKDGLGLIGRGNWGVVVQKLKKRRLIECCGGEEGKPGALYKNVTSEGSTEPSPVGGLFS